VAEDALALSGDPPLKKYIVLAEMAERLGPFVVAGAREPGGESAYQCRFAAARIA